MKYLLLLLALLSPYLSAATTQTVMWGDKYVVISADTNQTFKSLNEAKDAASKLSKQCVCAVDVIPPKFTYQTVSATASSKSSSSSSSLPSLAKLVFGCLPGRQDGTLLGCDDMDHYELKRSDRVEIIMPTGNSMVYLTAQPLPNEKWYVAAIDKNKISSGYVEVQQ